MNKLDVKVLCIETSLLFPSGIWEGFKSAQDSGDIVTLIKEHGKFKRRGDLEEDPSYQQIIPQILLIVGNKLFIHRVPAAHKTETRLNDMWPIFLGGHVDETDLDINAAAEREFEEEINYQGTIIKKTFVGLIKLHDNPIDKVHTGMVWVYEGDSEVFSDKGDEGVADGKFVTWEEAATMIGSMTHWSKLAFPTLRTQFEK